VDKVEEIPTVAAKVAAKRYPTSVSSGPYFLVDTSSDILQDAPLREWAGENKSDPGFREEYLQEMLRLEGRGDVASHGQCMSCPATDAIYRCEDCMGRLVECSHCCLTRHKHLPLHIIQVSLVSES
jgi:hypothetical protein